MKINKAKLKTRILELLIIIATIITTSKAIAYANAWRGYKAFGGEYLIPLLGFIVIMIIETFYEESRSKKKRGGKHEKR